VGQRSNRVVAGIAGILVSAAAIMVLPDGDQLPTKIVVPEAADVKPPQLTTSVADAAPIGPIGPHESARTTSSPSTRPSVSTVPEPARPPSPPEASKVDPPPPRNPVRTVVCPSPDQAIGPVPAGARAEVDRELANLEAQLREANQRLATSTQSDPAYVQNAILGPLASKRTASLDRIAIAIGRFGPKPEGLTRFASCDVR
jgi:hypothetical protein